MGMDLDLAADCRIVGVNVARVRHEARRQGVNATATCFDEQRAVSLYVCSRVRVVSIRVDVIADITDPNFKAPIEVDERKAETSCYESADRALAGSARADQSDLLAAHVVE